MSTRSLDVVYKWSEHVTRQHAPSDLTACAGWDRCHSHATKTLDKHWTTVSHGCARSLLNPCPTNSNRSIHVFLSHTFCCIRVASNTERGIACNASTRAHHPDSVSASRLLVSTPSPLSYPHTEDGFRHSRYFAVCNAFVNPSAVFRPRRFLDHSQLSLLVFSLEATRFLFQCA